MSCVACSRSSPRSQAGRRKMLTLSVVRRRIRNSVPHVTETMHAAMSSSVPSLIRLNDWHLLAAWQAYRDGGHGRRDFAGCAADARVRGCSAR
jgi:hypothetical protein